MDAFTLHWPTDYDGQAWEWEAKGFYLGLEVRVASGTFRPVFYDPVRLAQDLEAGTEIDQERLIVVKRVNRGEMETAILALAEACALKRLAS